MIEFLADNNFGDTRSGGLAGPTGLVIILFLIVEPAGLARLWLIGKQKLRVWPFPY